MSNNTNELTTSGLWEVQTADPLDVRVFGPDGGGSCDGTLRRIGNNTGYTYRFYALRQGECQITLSAIGDREGILWDETYYIQVRK